MAKSNSEVILEIEQRAQYMGHWDLKIRKAESFVTDWEASEILNKRKKNRILDFGRFRKKYV